MSRDKNWAEAYGDEHDIRWLPAGRIIELVMTKFGCSHHDAVNRIARWEQEGLLHFSCISLYERDELLGVRNNHVWESPPATDLYVAAYKELVALELIKSAGHPRVYDYEAIEQAVRDYVKAHGRAKSKAKLHRALIAADIQVPELVQFRKVIAPYWDDE